MLAQVLHLSLWRAAHAPKEEPPVLPPTPPLVQVRRALARVERLIPKVVPPPPPPEEPVSPWDPEPVFPVSSLVRTPHEEEMLLQEVNGCKTLLLEMIRRAAYDWVLYRGSRRMLQKSLAEQAYRWLFLEVPGSPDWNERQREGKHITSFVSVCEGLDLDPEKTRSHIRQLTPKHVMSVGRPAEYRRRDVFSSRAGDEDVYSVPGALIEYSDVEDGSDEPSY